MLKGVVETSLKTVALLDNPLLQTIDPAFCATHQYCNEQALVILQCNGFMQETTLLGRYYKQLQDGVIWADLNWKNIHHFLHPKTRRGFWHFSNAAGDYLEFFNAAIKFVRQGYMEEAIFYLGAAAHLVQDMCVPHHAKCQLFDGHKQYEIWVEEHLAELSFTKSSDISIKNPMGVLVQNAEIALEFYSYVNKDARDDQYQKATEILLPLSNQSTANLFCYFFARTKKIMGVSSLECFL